MSMSDLALKKWTGNLSCHRVIHTNLFNRLRQDFILLSFGGHSWGQNH